MVKAPWHRWQYVASIVPPLNFHNQGWSPCVKWCEAQFGPNGKTWRYVGEGVFEFEDPKDLSFFLLKWKH